MDARAKNAIRWIEGLQKTRSKQGKGQLGDSKDGRCCLGYGCHLLEIPYNPSDGASAGFRKAVGLCSNEGDPNKYRYLGNGDELRSCVHMNDRDKFSFRQISRILQEHANSYFVPKVAAAIKKHFSV